MQRTLHILRVGLVFISLLLCLASLVFWIRSRRVTDAITLSPSPSKWSLFTKSGTLNLGRDRPWLEGEDLRRGMKMGAYERSLLGFGVKQTEEQRTWQSKSSRIIPYTTILKSYFVPLWFCCVVFSILPLVHFPRIIRRFRRRRLGLCLHCGYDLRASPDKCPECGHAPA